jgi:hypothetical protein
MEIQYLCMILKKNVKKEIICLNMDFIDSIAYNFFKIDQNLQKGDDQ